MSVIILRGIPGSGKSTLAKTYSGFRVVSADDYFVDDETGDYNFDPRELPQAHANCLLRFLHAMENNENVVVDNTNTTVVEVAPYAALALAYGRHLRIITVVCDPVIATARNVHGVSMDAVKAMHDRLVRAEFPPWWPHEEHRASLGGATIAGRSP